jgi:signal transduction histidine kinase/CheY-like chemotaxis protein
MRFAPGVLAVPLLILLLTWLSLRAVETNTDLFDRTLGEMDHFARLEAALHRDVLSARAGLLRDYDPLVQETNALVASLERLREIAANDAAMDAAIDRLAGSVDRQEELVEQFKSDNALLRNSLAYFGLFSSRLGVPDQRGSLGPAVCALAGAMLRLTLDTSSVPAREVQDRLNELAIQPVPPGDGPEVQALLAHGRMLSDLLPRIDSILKAIYSVPQRQDLASLRAMAQTRQSASLTTARRFRTLLYVTSLLLVGLLALLGLRLRTRTLRSRHRAAFEHLIAGISVRFVNTPPRDFEVAVEQALADMARHVRADRAYLLFPGSSNRTYRWRGPGLEFPPDWPEHAPALVERFSQSEAGITHVPRVNRLPAGEARNILAAAGLWAWACASRANGDGTNVLLGFDAIGCRSCIARPGELGVLRLALDAVAGAVRRQTLELERVRLETRLRQARHLETVGAFASGIAHNFNNIVGAILGYTEMANEQSVRDGQSARIFEEIRRAGERARELVDEILTFGRRRDVNRIAVSIQDVIAEAISLLRASLPATVEIAVGGTSESAIVSGTPTQLQQVILNLCGNAAQAMSYVGRVEIETAIVASDFQSARRLSHGDLAPGSYVRITVRDTGCGMDDSVLERIFEPFFTTRTGGSGLGLATARDIVHEHDGVINVRSAVGVGSCFEVWLPRIVTPLSIAGNDNDATVSLGHGETVLVIEDDTARLPRAEEVLAALGYEPVGFLRAAEARSALQRTPERFDVLVLGHVGSSMAALEIAASLREVARGLPILLATASADEIAADSLMVSGVTDVVHWPIVASDIAAALTICLAARRRETPIPRDALPT